MNRFTTKFATLVAGLMLYGISSMAMAVTCTSATSWGNLGATDYQGFGHSFSSTGNYADCYSFALTGNANSFGGVLETDSFFNRLDINVTGISIFNGGLLGGSTTGSLFGSDSSASIFGFNGLTLGTYSLVVYSNVSREWGLLNGPVGYNASITTVARPGGATSVPEPGILLLLALGLVGIALTIRRRAA